jgi:hypothetical protein
VRKHDDIVITTSRAYEQSGMQTTANAIGRSHCRQIERQRKSCIKIQVVKCDEHIKWWAIEGIVAPHRCNREAIFHSARGLHASVESSRPRTSLARVRPAAQSTSTTVLAMLNDAA